MWCGRSIIVLLLILLSACSNPGMKQLMDGNPQARLQWSAPDAQIVVPFRWHDRHLLIPVRVNGTVVDFALDTGAAATVLFETARTRPIRLKTGDILTLGQQQDTPGVRAQIAGDVDLELAGIRISDLTILHIPHGSSRYFEHPDAAYFDGAIGYDLLRHLTIRIDYVSGTLTLTRTSSATPPDPQWQHLAIDVRGRVLVVHTQLHDATRRWHDAPLLIDTGAPSYVYLNPSRLEGLQVPARHYLTRSRGFYRELTRTSARMEGFKLGDTLFEQPLMHFDTTDFLDLPGAIGVIGNGTLRNFDIVLDYAHASLWLRRNPSFQNESRADRSGLHLVPHRLGALAQSVEPGTAADHLGLTSGMIVTHLQGQQVTTEAFDRLKALLSSDLATLPICWTHATTQQCGTLTLADRL